MPDQLSSNSYPVTGGKYPHDTRNDLEYYGYPSVTERLLEYCSMDVVFVAIDFEIGNMMLCGRPKPNSMTKQGNVKGEYGAQAGISILDTRDLKKSPEIAVTARQYCVGGHWYCDTVPRRLLFGTSETHTLQSLYTTLTNLLRFEDPITKQLRPIVVIGYEIQLNSYQGDLHCLQKLTDPSIRSPIIDYLDITEDRVVYQSLGFNSGTSGFRGPGLQRILEHLSIPFANLHLAANDAMFTLRALLLMVVHDYNSRSQNLTSTERKILAELQCIALLPLSLPPGMKMRRIAFPNKGGLVRKCRDNRYATHKRARKELQNQEHHIQAKMEYRNRKERHADWADMDDFTSLWDLENEQILNDDENPLHVKADQTPITTDDESLEPSNESSDEPSNEFSDEPSNEFSDEPSNEVSDESGNEFSDDESDNEFSDEFDNEFSDDESSND